jgi:hypothetical protein
MCAHAYSFVCFWLIELCDFMTPVYIVNGVERILVIPIQDFRELQLSPVCSSRTPALWTNFCLPYCSCWWICHWGTVNLLSKLQASVWPVSSSFSSSRSKDWVHSRYTNQNSLEERNNDLGILILILSIHIVCEELLLRTVCRVIWYSHGIKSLTNFSISARCAVQSYDSVHGSLRCENWCELSLCDLEQKLL